MVARAADAASPCLHDARAHSLPPQKPTHAETTQGSVLLRCRRRYVAKTLADGTAVERERGDVETLHVDLIGDAFWRERPELLE